MPRRKRTKPNTIIPHLANPSNPSKRKRKYKRSIHKTTKCVESSCCNTMNEFIASIMKHFVIPSFVLNIIGCVITSYYLNRYIQTYCLFYINNRLLSHLLSYALTILCIASAITFHSYLYLIIALILSPKGHDKNAYSVGRGLLNPYRVFAFIYTCFQSLQTLSYFNSYFFVISSYLWRCKRLSFDTDLIKMEYSSYSIPALKRIISMANNRVLQSIDNEQRLERKYLKEKHYDEIIKQDTNVVRKCGQINAEHMISIFNVRFDKNERKLFANIFLPPSLSLSLNYISAKNGFKDEKHLIPRTPAIIFIVGGAWGSCDMSFSASAASSFVNTKIAFIYPMYTVYPDGNIQDMLSNINAIIEWIIKYSSALNINPYHLSIVGQSAGAHLGVLAILRAYQEKSPWVKRIRLFCGLSGPYCISDHYKWESTRGIENLSPMGRCMKGIHNFGFYSPSMIAEEMNDSDGLPHFTLIHSLNDYVVPISSSRKLQKNLNKVNINCELQEYEEGTHYDSLFGVCDMNNPLFNKLITDISSRLFICCRKHELTEEFYQEEKEEIVHFKARQCYDHIHHNVGVGSHQSINKEYDELCVAQTLQIKGIHNSLFKYDDVSMDPNKSNEAIQFMKNLLKDIDKATDLLYEHNQKTRKYIL